MKSKYNGGTEIKEKCERAMKLLSNTFKLEVQTNCSSFASSTSVIDLGLSIW